MRKFLKLFIVFISLISFSNNSYFSDILKERMKVIEAVKILSKNDYVEMQNIMTTGVSNDEFLFQIGTLDKKIRIANLILVFPDVNFVDKYIEKTSENVENIEIYLIDGEIKEANLENRDSESFFKMNLEDKIKKLRNVIVYSVKVEEEDIKKIFPNSLYKQVLEDEIVKKYILN